MNRSGKWLMITGLTLAIFQAHQAGASVPFQPVDPEELKMTSEPLAPGAPAIILYRQVDRDDSSDPGHQDEYIRIKVLTEEGRKYADVEIRFDRENEKIGSIRARTIQPNGTIVDFNGQVFEKNLVKGQGVKYLAKTFTLPGVQVGSIIEYSYTANLSGYWIFNSHWILNEELFTRKAEFSIKPYETSGSAPISLSYVWNALPPGTDLPKEGKGHITRMEAKNIPAFQAEDYMPPESEMKSRVDFIYANGAEPKDQATFWATTGKNWNEYLEKFIGKKKAMEEAVGQIVAPGDTQEVKLRKIYDRVQEIRNTSYEVQKTDQEQKRAREKPAENVEELWKRGYGDGTHLTWLFLGLARAAGFEAYGCWVSSRAEYFFTPATMEGRKLNANVVLVKLNGKDIYFDPGAAFTPYGMLAWAETGTPGLRLDKDGGSWIETSLPAASESRIARVAKLKLSETGDLEGKLTVTYTGLEAMYRRLDNRNSDDVERKKSLEGLVTSQIEGAAQAELTNKPDWTHSEAPLVAEFDLKIPGFMVNAGSRAMIPAAIFTAGEKSLFEHAERVFPIYLDYPYEKSDDITMELPAGWQVKSLPAALDRGLSLHHYSLKAVQGQGTLNLTRKLTMNFLHLNKEYYPMLRSFFQMVRTGDGEQVILQPGETNAGK
jgi:transglutaminase-like putative cysteine protease